MPNQWSGASRGRNLVQVALVGNMQQFRFILGGGAMLAHADRAVVLDSVCVGEHVPLGVPLYYESRTRGRCLAERLPRGGVHWINVFVCSGFLVGGGFLSNDHLSNIVQNQRFFIIATVAECVLN